MKEPATQRKKVMAISFLLLMAVFNVNATISDHSREDNSAPVIPLRQEIEELVKEKPGIFFRNTIRDTNRTVGVCQYHINRLLQEGKIISFETTNYKGYFPFYMKNLSNKRKTALVLLRVKNKGEILRILAERKEISQKELADQLNISVQNLSYHLKHLEDGGLIQKIKEGNANLVKLDAELENFLIINYI